MGTSLIIWRYPCGPRGGIWPGISNYARRARGKTFSGRGATREIFVIRQLCVAATFVCALQICPPARSQDTTAQQPPPSLGDIARKYREEKAEKDKKQTTAKIFTNDGLMTGRDGTPLVIGMPGGMPGQAGNRQADTTYVDALQALNGAMQKIDLLEATDRATLIKNATGGNDADFPGRREWEDRLVSAQHEYVAHGREVILSTKELMLEAKKLNDEHPGLAENDPRVVSLMTKLKDKNNEAQKMATEFRAIVQEGKDRAAQASGH